MWRHGSFGQAATWVESDSTFLGYLNSCPDHWSQADDLDDLNQHLLRLTYKADTEGYHPHLVLAGRRINDGMGRWLVEQMVLEMARRGQVIGGTEVLLLGLTFKENCPDLRNTRVVDVIEALQSYGMQAVVVDPWVNAEEARREYGLEVLAAIPAAQRYRAAIAAVAHRQFAGLSAQRWQQLLEPQGVLMDLKGIVPRSVGAVRL